MNRSRSFSKSASFAFSAAFCLLALGVSGINSTAHAANVVLNTSQIKGLLANRTIKQVDDQYYAYYTSGGQVKALYVNAVENGSWSVANNQVCHQWQTWNKGKRSCFFVIQGQQGAYRFQDASANDGFNFTLKNGNQQGL
ncbi:MAG: hypothetical protein ACPGVN_00045 [Alphaproteobacteria bacterium]